MEFKDGVKTTSRERKCHLKIKEGFHCLNIVEKRQVNLGKDEDQITVVVGNMAQI